ncbi:cation:proton antiporter [Photobacterium sp. BZF1]|uniref:cation:proton antiporter domain-containing protein n=1 Tax=Photobacterium sp. BZF1 TaxID=1904457 RepID=UPI001653A4C9|nr:cation:proton antiporter [Photobacterium sp. BZF1]MBC7006175.1 cation:proton antiporter [Photobacterium sp. BZF1]
MSSLLFHIFIYLSAAVLTVPIAKKFGMGSVLGYLIAGVVIGPVVGLVGEETHWIQHIAEFGVVMMLFLVGLELDPKALWKLRYRLVGLGGLQILLTSISIMLVGIVLGLIWQMALTIGMIFSLSSTAIVLQTLEEKKLNKTEGGRGAFSVLLFQDIAVIPIIAVIPWLVSPTTTELNVDAGQSIAHAANASTSFIDGLSGGEHGLLIAVTIILVLLIGHVFCRPFFRFVANAGVSEISIAASLMLVVGVAGLMTAVGLSPALGAFLAGMVLANSEFKFEIEANLAPSKGLLLGLFFITVGANINFTLLTDHAVEVIAITLSVMAIKAVVLWLLAKLFKLPPKDGKLLSVSLAQAGEFGFVLLGFALQSQALTNELSQLLSLVITLSMILTPGMFYWLEKRLVVNKTVQVETPLEEDLDSTGPVIVAGVGRFGHVVNRLLVTNGIKTTVLDRQPERISNLRSVDIEGYFGDASQLRMLQKAGIAQASMLVLAIDDTEEAVNIVTFVKQSYPEVYVLARAYDRKHYFQLKNAGADYVVAETYHSALALSKKALSQTGLSIDSAEVRISTFSEIVTHNNDVIYDTWRVNWRNHADPKQLAASVKKTFIEVDKSLVEKMKKFIHQGSDHDENGKID